MKKKILNSIWCICNWPAFEYGILNWLDFNETLFAIRVMKNKQEANRCNLPSSQSSEISWWERNCSVPVVPVWLFSVPSVETFLCAWLLCGFDVLPSLRSSSIHSVASTGCTRFLCLCKCYWLNAVQITLTFGCSSSEKKLSRINRINRQIRFSHDTFE